MNLKQWMKQNQFLEPNKTFTLDELDIEDPSDEEKMDLMRELFARGGIDIDQEIRDKEAGK